MTIFVAAIFGVLPAVFEGPATTDAEGDGRAAGIIGGWCGGAGPMLGGTTILTERGHYGPSSVVNQQMACVVAMSLRIRCGGWCGARYSMSRIALGTSLVVDRRDVRYRCMAQVAHPIRRLCSLEGFGVSYDSVGRGSETDERV